jgi:hypothetical protein
VQSHTHRDGLDCLNYLLDLVNHCAGYSDKYYDEHHKRLNSQQLHEKYKQEKALHEQNNFKDSPLLADKYPHCLLVIEAAHTLFEMTS